MAPRNLRTRVTRRAEKAGIFLPDELADALVAYYELLSRWNRKINLTSIEAPDEAIDRLLLEPVAAARYISTGATSLMDVGSGGGSPAIPMKLTRRGLSLVMVEAKARKSAFLREAIRQLELSDTTVETSRYEQLLGKPELLESFDVLSLRAVRVEPKVMMLLQAFLSPGGQMLLFRGPTGSDTLSNTVPPLEWLATHPLIDTLQSRLTVVRKQKVWADVPRGT